MENTDGEMDTDSVGYQRESSILFRRNRAIGYVSNQIPAVVRYIARRKDNLITTCIGRSFQVYTATHFRLIHVGPQHPDDITAMCGDRKHFYTAADRCIYAWRGGKHQHHVYRGHKANIHLLLPFGHHLIAVDESNVLKVWDIKAETVYLEIPFNREEFQITAIAHPPTYINKMLFGSKQGTLQLWNLKDNRLVYTFDGQGKAVTCIEPAPAIDVVAIGHQDGHIVIMNLKYDKLLMEFRQDWGSVTRITFRTDGPPIMASASLNGHMAFWNLEERKVVNQLQAHEDTVTTAICMPNEPLLLTTSPDNSLKMWIFDMSDGGARLLRIREGHTAPPLCIRHHGWNGSTILSSGEDSSLRSFSTITETFNKSLGKASYHRKSSKKKNRFQTDVHRMPPIKEFTTETTREREWDNIAAIHLGCIQATTWSFHKSRMGEHRLIPQKFYNRNRDDFNTQPTCLILTQCGNFVIIGYSNGDLERFNIQSGQHRTSYGDPAHTAPVRGVITDSLNQMVVSGCSVGYVKFWHFKNLANKPRCTMKLKEGITLMRCHRDSALMAIAMVNYVVIVIDLDTKVVIRKFEGHTATITDMAFNPDSRWLITASMDATIKVWDIPSSYMIDHFRVERPCVSLSMSPTGDFLATAHVNYLGIYLWSNKMLYNQISLRSIDPYAEPPFVSLPAKMANELSLESEDQQPLSNGESLQVQATDGHEIEGVGEEINSKYKSPQQLSGGLVTMSGVAISRWQNLFDLEIIKKRNKPRAPPKVPKQAPFFLPTVDGLEMKFDVTDLMMSSKSKHNKSELKSFSNLTEFGKLLESHGRDTEKVPSGKDRPEESGTLHHYSDCIQFLKKLGPSKIDFEIRSLQPFAGGSIKCMEEFLRMVNEMFKLNRDFELAQSYLSVFLRANGLELLEFPSVLSILEDVLQSQEESWHRLESKLIYGMGVIAALRNFV